MLSLENGKSQSSLLIIAVLVCIFIIGWLVTFFLSVSFSKRILEETLLAKVSKYLDYIKGFSRSSLLLAIHSATKQVASQGGQTSTSGEVRNWICNADISPDLEVVKFFLSEETKKYVNSYLENLKIKDLPTIILKNFTCIDYDVNGEIFFGKYDEKFNTSGFGSKINIFLKDNNVSSSNELYMEIGQDRFWFMYRKFKEWVPQASQLLVDGLCQCLSEICNCPNSPSYLGECEACGYTCPGFQSCLESLSAQVNKILNDSFNDPYINCKWFLKGCYHELEPCSGSVCQDWAEAPKCRACNYEKADELCSKFLTFLPSTSSFQSFQLANLECEKLKCKYWAETKGSFEVQFSCTDYKYLLSVSGDRHLTFSVGAMAKMKARNCERSTECEDVNGECKCKDPGTWCPPLCI
jgi:hypothetical protein